MVAQRQRHRHPHVACACVSAHVIPREIERAVLEIRAQHFVARLQVERPRCDVDTRGHVRNEDKVVRISRNVCGERSARVGKQSVEPAREKLDGTTLQVTLPFLIALEDRARTRAE